MVVMQTNGYWLFKKGHTLHYAPPKHPVSEGNASTMASTHENHARLFMGSLKSIIKFHPPNLLLLYKSSQTCCLSEKVRLRDAVRERERS